MSTDSSKKRIKHRKKANTEALLTKDFPGDRMQQGGFSYSEEDETFSLKPADGDQEPLVEQDVTSREGGSGLCSKIIFFLLLTGLAVSVGVIFLELGGTKDGLLHHIDEHHVHEEVVYESRVPHEEAKPEDHIQPTYLEEVESGPEEPTAVEEEVNEARIHQVESEPETVSVKEVEEALPSEESETLDEPELEYEPVEELVPEQSAEPVPQEAPTATEPEQEAAPAEEEEVTPTEAEEKVEGAPREAETPVETVEEREVPEQDAVFEAVPEQVPESQPEAPREVRETEHPEVESAEEATVKQVESQQEDIQEAKPESKATPQQEAVEEPTESYSNKAEREAVQDALEQVWVLSARCVEELRAFQTVAKNQQSFDVVEDVTQRLSPLRQELNDLVSLGNQNAFDGLLEKISALENKLLAVLGQLESAREAESEIVAEEEGAAAPEAEEEKEEEAEINADDDSADEAVAPELSEQADQPAGAVDVAPPTEEQPKSQEQAPVVTETESAQQDEAQDQPIAAEPFQGSQAQEEPVVAAAAPLVEEEQIQSQPVAATTVDEPAPAAEHPAEQATQEERKTEEGPGDSLKAQLEEAGSLIDQSPQLALQRFEHILERHPTFGLALYGRAEALDKLAEKERSNARLEQAIFAFRSVLDLEQQVDDALYRKAAQRCIDRMRFRGFTGKAIRIQQRLISRFPNDVDLRNQLAVSYLMAGQAPAAKEVLEEVLQRWPNSGFAKVHYGFILKTTYNDNEGGAKHMAEGIATRESGVIDGRFFFHLGDALARLGRLEEARKVYVEGEKEGLFLSRDQRSLYNVDRLTGRPWWTKEQTTYGQLFDQLEANWKDIRDEGVSLLKLTQPEGFVDESENLRDTGDWKQFELYGRGRRSSKNCLKAPKTCALIDKFPAAAQCKRGQIKFSIMHPGTHVWPHTGPTNCRLRAHLGLVVPEGVSMRVGNETRLWQEGKVFIFDDSFEHEVWHEGSSYRLVLIVDVWHPELSEQERNSLSPI